MELVVPRPEVTALEKLRAEELEEALHIQNTMLPAGPLQSGKVVILHDFRPVSEVGGDFLDYFELPDQSLGLYLGDVSGKGLPAALYAALAVGTLRGVHKTGQCPGAVLSLLNRRLLVRGIPRRHAAVQYAVFDPVRREMQLASGGLPGPLHLTAQGCHKLHLPGMPAGLFMEAEYSITKISVEPGDSVLFFTDGITDAVNEVEELFGMERLVETCVTHAKEGPKRILARLFDSIGRFSRGLPQHDDMTAAVFHCAP